MKKRTRLVGALAVVLVAVGAIGYIARDRGSSASRPAVETAAPSDGVTAAIDKALGRAQAGTGAQTAPGLGPAPSQAQSPAAPAKPALSEAGSVASQPANLAPQTSITDQKIVQTGTMRLQVKDVGGSFAEIGQIAAGAGGFVASSSFSLQGNQQVATVTIRVPANRYQDVLAQVRALGAKVDGETSSASDVTEEYTDLSGLLQSLQATRAQLLQLLGQAKSVSDVLQVQDRLNSVQTQIDQTQGRINLLDKLSDMSTLTVQLRPVVAPAKVTTGGHDLGAEVSRAWQSSLDFLGGIAAGILTVVVFSWWIALLALPASVIALRWLRSRSRRPAAATYD